MKKHGQIKALKLPRIALCMMCAFCIVMVAMTAGCAKREDMEKHVDPGQSASGSLPAFLYYVENSNEEGGVCIYPYFVVGQSEEVRIIPISPDYLEELKGSGVEIRAVT